MSSLFGHLASPPRTPPRRGGSKRHEHGLLPADSDSPTTTTTTPSTRPPSVFSIMNGVNGLNLPTDADTGASLDMRGIGSPNTDVAPEEKYHEACEDSSSTAEVDEDNETPATTTKTTTIAQDAFDNERSRALFDAIDQFQSCGAGEYIDIPQLVIVGDQSTGKSSLLRSLTDIPFPVASGLCTRFATRILSRRTAPGTSNQVKITIVPPNFNVDGDFGYDHTADSEREDYRDYVQVRDALTADEFGRIMEEVTTTYMGINPGTGVGCKNFATEVLKIEISGPTRPHFSILDIPGIFSNPYNVRKREMEGVWAMVTEYMKQPENIVICVADAVTDLARQDAPLLADQLVDKSRLIGVFTKCDLVKKADSVFEVINGKSRAVGELAHHGWFVVRNRADGDEDDSTHKRQPFDLNETEAALFSTHPWTQVSEDRRGTANLKAYLGNLLCNKIEEAFPRLLTRLTELSLEAETALARLGRARDSPEARRAYLVDVAQRYEAAAREALERPWRLDTATARVRRLVREANDGFAARMRTEGHVYGFEDQDMGEEDYMARLGEIISPTPATATATATAAAAATTTTAAAAATATNTPAEAAAAAAVNFGKSEGEQDPVRPSADFFQAIRDEIANCGCTQLPGQVHPDIIPRLYRAQTRKWHSMAQAHLDAVSGGVMRAAEEILASVLPPGGAGGALKEEWLAVLKQSHAAALTRASASLHAYCRGEETKLLQTTDPGFGQKLRIMRSLRMMTNMEEAIRMVEAASKRGGGGRISVKELEPVLFGACHHSTVQNTANEVHDVLKVYYEFSLHGFIRHVTNVVVEDFVTDAEGPLRKISVGYVYGLEAGEVDRLGRESMEVAQRRALLGRRIETLGVARGAARAVAARY